MITTMLGEQIAKSIRYVEPVPFATATGLTAAVYQQLQADFMPAPLIALHSPVPQVLAGVWSLLRETLVAGTVDRARKEAVAAAVSKMNECPFCVEAHTVMLRATSDHDAASAILNGDYESIRDPDIHALVQWVVMNRTANPDNPITQPFSASDAPEIIGTALAFQYLNRMANVFLGDSLLPIPSSMKGMMYRLYAATAGKRIIRPLESGRSLKLLSQIQMSDELTWANENSAVAGAFAGFAHAVEGAGAAVLPEAVRLFVMERIAGWNGESMGMSRRWVDNIALYIEEKYRPAVRLMLLTAFASYQVDENIIHDFRLQHPDDAQLIAATAWASWMAARRAGNWLTSLTP